MWRLALVCLLVLPAQAWGLTATAPMTLDDGNISLSAPACDVLPNHACMSQDETITGVWTHDGNSESVPEANALIIKQGRLGIMNNPNDPNTRAGHMILQFDTTGLLDNTDMSFRKDAALKIVGGGDQNRPALIQLFQYDIDSQFGTPNGLAEMYFATSRGATPLTRTAVDDGDWVGVLRFFADDGTDMNNTGAEIYVAVDETHENVATDVIPAKIVFRTLQKGPIVFRTDDVERARITGLGNFGIGTSDPSRAFHVTDALGTVPSLDPPWGLAAIFQRNASTADSSGILILSGNASTGSVFFGDAQDGDVGAITYDHTDDRMHFIAGAVDSMQLNSSGLLTIADLTCSSTTCVTLGTETTGSYISAATASQGLTVSTAEGGDVGIQDCAASQIMKRNVGDTAWECAADGGGTILGDIIAGSGLTGGNADVIPGANTTLTVGAGQCITVAADTVGMTADCIDDGDVATGGIGSTSLAAGSVSGGSSGTIMDGTVTRDDVDEALLSIETHATDCTLLTCDAASNGEVCFEQDADYSYICDGSGTPAWKKQVPLTDASTDNSIKLWDNDAPAGWENRALSTGFVVGPTAITVDDSIFSPLGPTIGNTSAEFSEPTSFASRTVEMQGSVLRLPDGGTTSLTCTSSTGTRFQILDNGNVEWCDGAASTTERGITLGTGKAATFDTTGKLIPAAVSLGTTAGTGATECLTFYANKGMQCWTTNGCTANVTDTTYFTRLQLLFDYTTADDNATVSFAVPNNFKAAGLASLTFYWSAASGCDGGANAKVCWAADMGSFSDGDVFTNGTLDGTVSGILSTCTGTGGALEFSTSAIPNITHGMVAGELGVINIFRDIDGGNCTGDDTLAVSAALQVLKFCYEVTDVLSGEIGG